MVINITAHQIHDLLETNSDLMLLDIRELEELNIAQFPDSRVLHIPLSLITQQGVKILPADFYNKQQKQIVFCHLGIRSEQFCQWIQQLIDFPIYNLLGGIDAFTASYTPEIPRY